MALVERLIGWSRQKLDYPDLSRTVMTQAIWDRNQFYTSQLKNLSNEGYLLERFALAVTSGASWISLAALAPRFDGAFLVTTDTDFYTGTAPREVLYGRPQDVDRALAGISTYDVYGVADTVQFLSFWKDPAEGWRVQAYPQSASGNYTVWYEPGDAGTPALENAPTMPQNWHNLLAVSAAIDVLGQCKWPGLDDAGNAAKAQRLAPGLLAFKDELDREWRHFCLNAHAQHTTERRPFSSSPGAWRGYRNSGGF